MQREAQPWRSQQRARHSHIQSACVPPLNAEQRCSSMVVTGVGSACFAHIYMAERHVIEHACRMLYSTRAIALPQSGRALPVLYFRARRLKFRSSQTICSYHSRCAAERKQMCKGRGRYGTSPHHTYPYAIRRRRENPRLPYGNTPQPQRVARAHSGGASPAARVAIATRTPAAARLSLSSTARGPRPATHTARAAPTLTTRPPKPPPSPPPPHRVPPGRPPPVPLR